MLVGRAENLLYNLQASTYTKNEHHLNLAHNQSYCSHKGRQNAQVITSYYI